MRHKDWIVIDGLQYSNWSRPIFEQMHAGGLTAVHVTIAYWEDTLETLRNIGQWNRLFRQYDDLIMPVRTAADIREAKQQGKVGILFGAQNCSPLNDEIDMVHIFHQLGLRIMQLSYNNQSALASGCYEAVDSGITRAGKEMIHEMNRVGLAIDMSHSGERSTLEAIEHSSRPITVSHANPTFFHDVPRNQSTAVLKALGETGGMLGFSLYPLHLKNESACTLAQFCEMVARTAEIMGVDHIGIGTDLCVDQPYSVLHWMRNGRWRIPPEEATQDKRWPAQPDWIRTSADFPTLTAGLLDIGFAEADVAKIMGLNWLHFYEKSFMPEEASA